MSPPNIITEGSAEGNPSYQNNDPASSMDTATSDEPLLPQNSPTSSRIHRSAAPLKAWSLAVILFYAVSGGPFGLEPTIRAGGNFAAILGFIIAPLVFSVPEALVTAELGSAFQCASGGVAWVEEAFGESTGFLCGWLSWISGATDNAIYPILFIEYLESVLTYKDDDEELLNGLQRFGCVVGITVVLSFLNYRGLDIAAKTTLVICIVAMSPFVPMIIMAIPKIVPSRWLQKPEQGENVEDLFDDDFEFSSGPLSQTVQVPTNTIGNKRSLTWSSFSLTIYFGVSIALIVQPASQLRQMAAKGLTPEEFYMDS
eukprot:scaffold24550_cov60-Cyclotella_meneghiniana.AAC.7